VPVGAARQPVVIPVGIPEEKGFLHLLLLDAASGAPLAATEFSLAGPGLSLSARTDADGVYRRADVEFGEFRLRVGARSAYVPAPAAVGPTPAM